jgi:hypothetical protein
MVDDFIHAPLTLMVDHPEWLVIAPDRDYNKVIEDPQRKVDYILAPPPTNGASSIGVAYPTL